MEPSFSFNVPRGCRFTAWVDHCFVGGVQDGL
jgi:hypothetical protein